MSDGSVPVALEIRRALRATKEDVFDDSLPGETTASEYASVNGVSKSTARKELREAVEMGIATSRISKHKGNLKYYKFLEQEEE